MGYNKILNDFCKEHSVYLVTEEAGFGEIVTGFKKANMFIGIHDNVIGYHKKPRENYDKCDILAVKGTGEKAKKNLAEWISKLSNVCVNGYEVKRRNEFITQEIGNIDYCVKKVGLI